MKKWLALLIVVVLIISGILYVHYTHKEKKVQRTVMVKKNTIVEQSQAIGYIKPRHSITIKSQIDGTVAKIYHDEGEYVTKGEPLIRIKPEPSPIEYATTSEQLEEAITAEKSAKHDLDRYKLALKKHLITQNYTPYINAKKTYETTKLQRILAKQRLALLEKGNTKLAGKTIANIVKSPINGYILNRIVDVGDPVLSLSSPQVSTPLFIIADMHDLMFEGAVDEMDADRIHTGMLATITIGASPNAKITGVLTKIGLQSEQESASQGVVSTDLDSPFNVGFKVKITKLYIPKSLKLRSGYSATANIIIKSEKNILVLPMRLVHFEQGKSYVLLPSKGKEKPKKQWVQLGLSDGMQVQIKTGLKLGERVLSQ